MLEKPDIPDELIVSHAEREYAIQVERLEFLPLGADAGSAVYRVAADGGETFFLKLRKKGAFDPIAVDVPRYLRGLGIPAVVAPLENRSGGLWSWLQDYHLILYPYIDGKDGYEQALTEPQWRAFGRALAQIHAARLPAALAARIPRETFSPYFREQVAGFQAQVEQTRYDDPVAARLAAFMREKRDVIDYVTARAAALASRLQASPPEMVLCHNDIHAGNLLLPTCAGDPAALYIVDWDAPVFAPKERDLAMVGGSSIWNKGQEESVFYLGYDGGRAAVNAAALAYYRYERIVQDMAAFCEELLLTNEGGKDREQSFEYFTANFLPGGEIDIAMEKDTDERRQT